MLRSIYNEKSSSFHTAARIDRARALEHVFGGVMATVLH